MFYGLTNNEAFVDWVSDVDDYFAFVPVDENISAQLVALRLKGCAKAWWRQTQSSRANKHKGPILSWRKMKSLMYERFLPANYQRALFTEYLNCRQGLRSADDFHRLSARSELKEGDEQMIARFIAGLRLPIQDCVVVLSTYSLADSMNRDAQIEKQIAKTSRSPAFSHPARIEQVWRDSSGKSLEQIPIPTLGHLSFATSVASRVINPRTARDDVSTLMRRSSLNQSTLWNRWN